MINRHVVVRRVERGDPDVIAGLGAAGTATVHEAIGRRGFVGPEIRPIQQGVQTRRVGDHRVESPWRQPDDPRRCRSV